MSSEKINRFKHQKQLTKAFFCFSISLIIFLVFFFVNHSGVSTSSAISQIRNLHLLWFQAPVGTRSGYMISTPGCEMPRIDPFHPSIKQFYQNLSSYKCNGRTSFLKYSANCSLVIDVDILSKEYNLTRKDVSCKFREIRRLSPPHNPTDDEIEIGRFKPYPFGSKLNHDAVSIECFDRTNQRILRQFIPLVRLKPNVERRCKDEGLANERMNIIFLGIDSISKLNFLRHMSKTRKVLSTSGFFEMKGYNKVGENTFPNIYPMLTGRPQKKSKFYDDIGLIWKDYAKYGYRTLLVEDAPGMATFNYLKKGFQNPPTDYYLRPYSLAVERSEWYKNSKSHCFGSKMEIEVYYDYFKHFLERMQDRRFFAFVYMARLTHDRVNYAGYADQPASRMLDYVISNNLTNNSLVFFFSDHGIRFGKLRSTYVGKLEENWPYMFVSVPGWFLAKNPGMSERLRTNCDRLTTPFDVHATVGHYLRVITGNPVPEGPSTGISLFEDIPIDRTCDTAAIPSHYCTCEMLEPVDITSRNVRDAVSDLMTQVNGWLQVHPGLCANLTLVDITDARQARVTSDKGLKSETKEKALEILVSVTVAPSDGRLESTLRKTGKIWKVVGDVSRTDRYGRQGECVNDAWLEKFCFCFENKTVEFRE